MKKLRQLFKKPKEEPIVEAIIYSYKFPEGTYVGHSYNKDLEGLKFVMTRIIFSFPISYLLEKYNFIKPKIIKTFTIRKYDDEIYKYMREAIDECGYSPLRLLNKNLKLYGYTDDDIKKQKINMDIFFNNKYDSDVDLSKKRRRSF